MRASRFRRFSLASDKGRTAAMIRAAGAVARYRANPAAGWDRETEERIIRQALAERPEVKRADGRGPKYRNEERAFNKVTHEAARIVAAFFS